MDPAGPYFTSVKPIVRLDRNDAQFVDVIHTNMAPLRVLGKAQSEMFLIAIVKTWQTLEYYNLRYRYHLILVIYYKH